MKNIFTRNKVSSVEIPETDTFDCEIETPQFHGSQDKFHMHRQSGTFHKSEMKFYPYKGMFGNYSNGDHEVCFHSIDGLRKALIKIL